MLLTRQDIRRLETCLTMLMWGLKSPTLLAISHSVCALCIDPPSAIVRYYTLLGYPLRILKCRYVYSYNCIKQKTLFYQDKFIDRMIQVTIYQQLHSFMIISAHITLFFRTVANILIDDQLFGRNFVYHLSTMKESENVLLLEWFVRFLKVTLIINRVLFQHT